MIDWTYLSLHGIEREAIAGRLRGLRPDRYQDAALHIACANRPLDDGTEDWLDSPGEVAYTVEAALWQLRDEQHWSRDKTNGQEG